MTTDTVKEQVTDGKTDSWMQYMGCIVVKFCRNGSVINKAALLVLDINTYGKKKLLAMWLAENEGASSG